MNTQTKNELKNILNGEGGNIFDFIAQNYYLLSSEELKDIAKECADLMYRYGAKVYGDNGRDMVAKVNADLKENIIENTFILED